MKMRHTRPPAGPWRGLGIDQVNDDVVDDGPVAGDGLSRLDPHIFFEIGFTRL